MIYELKKIQDTIIQLENERLAFLNIFEERKKAKDEESHAQIDPVETIEQEAKDRVEEEKLEKLERLRGIELQRMENEFFKAQIDNMVN